MKKVLIISPYFPPSNTPDMQRVRMSIPYFQEFGWIPEVVTVEEQESDMVKDSLLIESIPASLKLYKVPAFSKKITSKLGLGSIAIRSLWFYKKHVDFILANNKIDLIYFSTTQFPVCILGAHWKKKFGVPYVIDMQDPWHTTYYEDKPKSERPPKYWFSYRLNKYLEPIAMKQVSGLISVSEGYIKDLFQRYPLIKSIPWKTITFGTFPKDFEIARAANIETVISDSKSPVKNIVYVGVAGAIMKKAILLFLQTLNEIRQTDPILLKKFKFYFVGTSYAPAGKGSKTIQPLAQELGLDDYVEEFTDRVTFYNALKTITTADGLLIPGTDAPQYTASKLYPYIMASKPILALLHPESSAVQILNKCNVGSIISIFSDLETAKSKTYNFLSNIATAEYIVETDWEAFEAYTARQMAKMQVELFNEVVQAP